MTEYCGRCQSTTDFSSVINSDSNLSELILKQCLQHDDEHIRQQLEATFTTHQRLHQTILTTTTITFNTHTTLAHSALLVTPTHIL